MLRTVSNDEYGKLPQVSASKIKTWNLCKKKYFYTYVSKPDTGEHREERSVGGLLGTVLHKVIETKYKNPDINPLVLYQEKMLTLLEEWQSKYIVKGDQWFTKSMKEGRQILETFDWSRFNPTALELYFSIPFPTEQPFCKLVGYIDMISDDNVIDHKSQKTIESSEEMANNAQFILYRYVFHALNGHYPKAVLWNDLRTNKIINTCVEEDYDNKVSMLIEDMKSMFSATEYPKIELSDTCRRLCGFYKLCWEGGENGKNS